jgi:hypothetical protein
MRHDLDLYRFNTDKKKIKPIEELLNGWSWQKETKFAVDKYTLKLRGNQGMKLALDHVSYSKKQFQPGSDLWANMFVCCAGGKVTYDLFHPIGPSKQVTLENALACGNADAVDCYVLRPQIFPKYKEVRDGKPWVGNDADGRFTLKLFSRAQPRQNGQPLVNLKLWKPKVTAIIKPGKNRDGYWQADQVIAQTARAIDAFEEQFPEAVGVFAFDRSSNHAAFAEDALQATVLRVGDKSTAKDQPKPSRPGWYIDAAGVRVQQEMNLESGLRKGAAPLCTCTLQPSAYAQLGFVHAVSNFVCCRNEVDFDRERSSS